MLRFVFHHHVPVSVFHNYFALSNVINLVHASNLCTVGTTGKRRNASKDGCFHINSTISFEKRKAFVCFMDTLQQRNIEAGPYYCH
jgi:hypothetical protein